MLRTRIPLPAILLVLAWLTAGHAAEFAPYKRPLTSESIHAICAIKVVVVENSTGIEKSWRKAAYADEAVGRRFTGIVDQWIIHRIDDAINSVPPRQATLTASQFATSMPPDWMTASLTWNLENAVSTSECGEAIHLASVSTILKNPDAQPTDDVLELSSNYVLSEDGTAMRVVVNAQYLSSRVKYVTPYAFKKSTPPAELEGPIYRNAFVYNSSRIGIPPQGEYFRRRLISAIQEGYGDDKSRRDLEKALAQANDGVITKEELAVVMAGEWLEDGATRMKREIENAHAFAVKYLIADLNSTIVPQRAGPAAEIEVLADGRPVYLMSSGLSSGTYESKPDSASGYATYGDSIAIAPALLAKIVRRQKKAR